MLPSTKCTLCCELCLVMRLCTWTRRCGRNQRTLTPLHRASRRSAGNQDHAGSPTRVQSHTTRDIYVYISFIGIHTLSCVTRLRCPQCKVTATTPP